MSQAHLHDHTHNAEDPYYLDQMCLIALSAVFGVVCLSLYFWRVDILKVMLGSQFHPFVLISGVILIILAVLRGISLWIQVGKDPVHLEDHQHAPATLSSLPLVVENTSAAKEPAACNDHDHGHCGHDHHHDGHAHSHADHDHAHGEHDHSHGPGHSHGHGDHDHGWAPWRYVVLLVPIILFFLGIPSTPPQAREYAPEVDHTREAMLITSWIAQTTSPLTQAAVVMAHSGRRRSGDAPALDFRTLENSAGRPDYRDHWAGKFVKVKGQYVPNPNPNNKRVFSVGRFSINCCRQDAVQLNVPIICSEEVNHIKHNEWIQVTGEIKYRKDAKGVYQTQLIVHSKDDIVKTAADADPYISAN